MSSETEPISRDYQAGGWKAHRILIVCSLLYMINYMDRTVITVVMQPMKLEMGLTDMQLGSIQMAYMLSHGVLAFPVAYVIDRWSRKKSIGIMALAWSVFAVLTGLARNFAGLLVPRTCAGISGTALATGGVSMLTAAYPRRKHGIVMGIFHAAIPLGIAIGAIFGGIMAARLGWRSPFFFLAGLSAILGISAFFMEDYKTIAVETTGRLKGFGQSVIKLLKIPTLRWFLPGYGLLLLTIQAQIAWLPAYLMRQFNWATDQAGNITGIIGLMAIIGAPLGGMLADIWYRKDRRSRLWLPAVSAVLSSIFLAVCFLTFSLNFATGLTCGLLFGILNMTAIPVLSSV
ncbi:MAG: MFS transporter, partial [Chloroflexi bacterium]|nr:MFS transporter [Chloroflexota bacterium]